MMSIFSTYVTNSAYKDLHNSLFITCIVAMGPKLLLTAQFDLKWSKVILLVMQLLHSFSLKVIYC